MASRSASLNLVAASEPTKVPAAMSAAIQPPFRQSMSRSRAKLTVPTSPSATTLKRLVPLATCSERPRSSSAGSVTDEPLLARVLTKPPTKPAMATRNYSKPVNPHPSLVSKTFYPCRCSDSHAAGPPDHGRLRPVRRRPQACPGGVGESRSLFLHKLPAQAMVRPFTIHPCPPTKSWYVLQVYV
jgi:hypothetical protein